MGMRILWKLGSGFHGNRDEDAVGIGMRYVPAKGEFPALFFHGKSLFPRERPPRSAGWAGGCWISLDPGIKQGGKPGNSWISRECFPAFPRPPPMSRQPQIQGLALPKSPFPGKLLEFQLFSGCWAALERSLRESRWISPGKSLP